MQFILYGQWQGWINTGFQVKKGQWIRIQASGNIGFAYGGWNRGPDGKDEHGVIEFPASKWDKDNKYHPAGNCIKNSLVARIGGQIQQCGFNTTFRSNYNGVLELTNNDNETFDNAGAWQVNIQHGLIQKYLLVVQDFHASGSGSTYKDPNKEIVQDFDMFTRTIFDASGGQITINYDQPIYISTPVQAVEFVRRNTGEGYYAQLDNLLIDALNKIGIAATTYDGITRVYPSSAAYSNCVPASTPGYLNCIKGMTSPSWQNYYIPNSAKAPGVSAITVYAGNRPAIVNPATGKSELWETMFHEYQHMMGHRFFNTGIYNYGDPDKYGAPGYPSAPDLVNFYYRLMEKLLDATTVPYLKLENIFGRFEG